MRKIVRSIIMAIAIVLLASLTGYVPTVNASNSAAQAASLWTMTDGFEGLGGNPWNVWSCWQSIADPDHNNMCTIFSITTSPFFHSGQSSALIKAKSGWSDIGRGVSLSPFLAGRRLNCVAQMYVRPQIFWSNGTDVQLEVIDSATWTYISIKPIHLTQTNWSAVTTSTWIPAKKDVFVRIGIVTNPGQEVTKGVYIDDLTVQCQY